MTETLTTIFERVLERHPVHADDDFFDLGGSSMLAISLILEIEKETGRELPISSIYDAPTIGRMAVLLGSDQPASFSPLTVLRPGTGPTCLFLVHGFGGNVRELEPLALRLPAEVTVYGIQAVGLGGEAPHDRVEAMASAYVEMIRTVQPNGPYWLVGYSLGGLVTFEMTRLLQQRGEQVRFLGLIDSYPEDGILIRRLGRHVARLLDAGPSEVKPEIDRIARGLWSRARRTAGLPVGPPPASVEYPPAVMRVRTASLLALRRYRAARCTCDVTFFQASLLLKPLPADPIPIWRPLVRRLTVEKVAGDHLSMVQADVASIGAVMARHLQARLACA